jgi:hypothetical protein
LNTFSNLILTDFYTSSDFTVTVRDRKSNHWQAFYRPKVKSHSKLEQKEAFESLADKFFSFKAPQDLHLQKAWQLSSLSAPFSCVIRWSLKN